MIIVSHTRKEQFGGFQSLEIIRLSDILNCPDVLTNFNIEDFTYSADDEDDAIITPVGETINISAKPNKTDGGLLYDINSKFTVAYLDLSVDNLLANYLEEKVIVKGVTNSGFKIIYGSKENPLQFTYELMHSENLETTSKYNCRLSARIPQKPVMAKV